ncbi:MAG: hypothetical protein GY757_10070 [bacterium]|nr:hypothetical protein [bacterium]
MKLQNSLFGLKADPAELKKAAKYLEEREVRLHIFENDLNKHIESILAYVNEENEGSEILEKIIRLDSWVKHKWLALDDRF